MAQNHLKLSVFLLITSFMLSIEAEQTIVKKAEKELSSFDRSIDRFGDEVRNKLKEFFTHEQPKKGPLLLEPRLEEHKNVSQLRLLLNDFNNYKTTNKFAHSGNLYQHSMWTEQEAAELLDDPKCIWSQGLQKLNNHEKYVLALAALLHDIGKGGDHVFSFKTKPGHDQVGFKYILGKQSYKLKNGKSFNFDKLFKEEKISADEQKLIAILIGMHLSFGEGLMASAHKALHKIPKKKQHSWWNLESKNGIKLVLDPYLEKLKALTKEVNYNNGIIDEKLLREAIFVGVADAKGTQPATGKKSIIFKHPTYIPAVRKTTIIVYDFYHYDTFGKALYHSLITYFREHEKNKEISKIVFYQPKSWLQKEYVHQFALRT